MKALPLPKAPQVLPSLLDKYDLLLGKGIINSSEHRTYWNELPENWKPVFWRNVRSR